MTLVPDEQLAELKPPRPPMRSSVIFLISTSTSGDGPLGTDPQCKAGTAAPVNTVKKMMKKKKKLRRRARREKQVKREADPTPPACKAGLSVTVESPTLHAIRRALPLQPLPLRRGRLGLGAALEAVGA